MTEDLLEDLRRILERVTPKEEILEGELYTTRTISYERPTNVSIDDWFKAVFALFSDRGGEQRTRRVIESCRDFAQGFVLAADDRSLRRKRIDDEPWWQKLRGQAQAVLARIFYLQRAIEKANLHDIITSAMCLERDMIRLDQTARFAEANAALGRKKRESLVLGGKKRQKAAAKAASAKQKRARQLYNNYQGADYEPHEILAMIAKRLNSRPMFYTGQEKGTTVRRTTARR